MTSKIRSGSGNPRNFRDSYVLGKVLGEGHCSTVRKCRHKFSKSCYAAKLISLDCEQEEADERREMLQNEVKVLRLLKHDNIVKFVDVFYSTERIIVISELGEVSLSAVFIICKTYHHQACFQSHCIWF